MPRLVPDCCKHFPRGIDDLNHRCDAKIILIGEAPGRNEDERGIPFCGASGFQLDRWLESVGLRRSDLYITNVVRRRPPGNEIYAVPFDVRERSIEELHERLSHLADPTVIVPTGDVALNALMRIDLGERLRITDWRGSICSYTDRSSRRIKVIPTIHPAATLRQPILSKFCTADWKRIAGDSTFPELRLPARRLIIDPSNQQVEEFIQGAISAGLALTSPPPAMAIDVENTMKDDKFDALTCVGFSFDPATSLTISIRRSDYSSEDSYRYAWNSVKALCALSIPKVMQNGLTDAFKLNHVGIPVRNYQWDLMEMDHALDPNDGGDTEKGSEDAVAGKSFKLEMRSLKILTSLYTREPFYKLEGKHPYLDWVRFLRYNGKDCCVTREIYGVLWAKLNARGLVQ